MMVQLILLSRPKDEDDEDKERWHRISFMTNESTPYTSLLMRVRANRRDSSSTSPSPRFLTSILSQQSDLYGAYTGTGSMLLVFNALHANIIFKTYIQMYYYCVCCDLTWLYRYTFISFNYYLEYKLENCK
jgi:hypothetical protein